MSVTSEGVEKITRAGGLRSAATPTPSLFEPGRNCYRVGQADRVSLLIDGEAYFNAFVQAALRATRTIVIVGWDFHSRTQLHHGIEGVPEMLGDFLNYLAKRRRRLDIRILTWDYPVLFSKGRELSPIYGLGWRPHRRVRLRYDDHYPVGASQHQKIVVIDGTLAFCGGLDLTRSRWDTKDHAPHDHRRVNEGEEDHYAPFHDTVMAVDGEAARVLDEIVRDRWFRATGHPLKRKVVRANPWPPSLPVALTDASVAFARTRASFHDDPQICEVQALYLDMIARAKHTIYIENQYFTSNSLGEALAARLAEDDGPEIIAVLRLSTQGWLEAPTMGTLRTVLLKKLRDADKHGRFHAYYPHIPGLPEGQCCDLHSKLMIIDDEVVRIGSANFSNRSMGLDTECDAAIEARGDERLARVIRAFRDELLAEHLAAPLEQVQAAIRGNGGSVRAAIESLMSEDRSLRKYERLDDVSETLVSVASVADPEQPVSLDALIAQLPPEEREAARRPRWMLPLTVVAVVAALAAMWRYTPLATWTDAANAVEWANNFSTLWWAPIFLILAYTPACLTLFPRPIITLLAVAAFGPWLGFAYAISGILIACALTYYIGTKLNRHTVRRLARGRLTRMSQILRHRGIVAMTAVRLVPIAPFSVVNTVAGAIHLRFRDFMIGSALGILPGTLIATVFGNQVVSGLKDPGSINLWLVGALTLALIVGTRYVRRWLFGKSSPASANHGCRSGHPA